MQCASGRNDSVILNESFEAVFNHLTTGIPMVLDARNRTVLLLLQHYHAVCPVFFSAAKGVEHVTEVTHTQLQLLTFIQLFFHRE